MKEFCYAREFMYKLDYTKWSNFNYVIEKAKYDCAAYGYNIKEQFIVINKRVKAGATTKNIKDYCLTTLACFFIVKNADIRKEKVKEAKANFYYELPNTYNINFDIAFSWDKIAYDFINVY